MNKEIEQRRARGIEQRIAIETAKWTAGMDPETAGSFEAKFREKLRTMGALSDSAVLTASALVAREFRQATANRSGADAPDAGLDADAVTKAAQRSWNSDPAIRAEFGTKETYLAFNRAASAGQIRMLGRSSTAQRRA